MPPDTTPAPQPPSTIDVVPLSQLGPQLPLGLGGARALAVRPWRMREERMLGALLDKNSKANPFEFISLVLCTMCTQLARADFESMSEPQRRLLVGQLSMGDVFYAYCWLRVQAIGKLMELEIPCERCKTGTPFTAALETIEVRVPNSPQAAQWPYALRAPFQMRGKEATDLVMGPVTWGVLERARGSLNPISAKPKMIASSIVEIAGVGPVTVDESELDDMSKADVEALTRLIDKNAIGPKMVVEGDCTVCGDPFRRPIEWEYGSFFAPSSR